MNNMTEEKANQQQARALLADIQAAPTTVIPRREPIVGWLNAFLIRSDQSGFVLGQTEAADLVALDLFLRTYDVPVSERVAA